MKKILAILFTFAFCMAASAQINPDVKPAAFLDDKPAEIGKYYSFTADNGMEVFLIRKEGYPKFRFSISFNVPTLFEEQQPEIRRITADILSKGSTRFSEKRIKEISEQLAGNVSSSVNSVVCSGLKRDINQYMPMLSGYLQSPLMNKDTIALTVAKEIKALKEKKDKPKSKSEWIQKLQDSLTFTKDGNPAPEVATIDGYKAISASDVRHYMKSYLNPKNSFCLVTGDFTVEEVKTLIAGNFKKWQGGEKFVSTYKSKYTPNYPTDRKIYVVDKPGAVQSKVGVSWPLIDGFAYGDNEPVLLIMNQIYGDGYNSKLNQNLRGDKGLTYGAHNFLNLNITGGSCTSQAMVRTAETAYALENIFFEMLRVRNEKVSQQDLDMAINGMLGDYARSISQLNSPTIIGFCMVKSEFKLPNDYLNTYPDKISKITAEDIRKTAQQYVQPYACNVVIEGNLAELKGKLEKFGPVFYFTSKGIRVN
jgi:zinc protease